MSSVSCKPCESVDAKLEDASDSDVISDDEFDCCNDDSSVVESSSDSNSDTELTNSSDFDEIVSTQRLGSPSQLTESDVECVRQALDKLPNGVCINNIQPMRNVNISNSQNVHIGPKTTVTGDIIIQKTVTKGAIPKVRQRRRLARAPEERVECVDKNVFMKSLNIKVPKSVLKIQPRWTWLAQKPMEPYDYVNGPVEYVIISHTASEGSTRQATNIKLIRHIQMYHIESYQWNDIAYNFMIGCDGNIYEGRGWDVVGAHTLGYNTKSLGIAFVGCFINEMPTDVALNALKNLLKKAVELGHLTKDYKLMGHCQVRPTESPGRMFFEELQKWKHFHCIEMAEEEDDSTDDSSEEEQHSSKGGNKEPRDDEKGPNDQKPVKDGKKEQKNRDHFNKGRKARDTTHNPDQKY